NVTTKTQESENRNSERMRKRTIARIFLLSAKIRSAHVVLPRSSAHVVLPRSSAHEEDRENGNAEILSLHPLTQVSSGEIIVAPISSSCVSAYFLSGATKIGNVLYSMNFNGLRENQPGENEA
ncbi:hypothetical protein U1Q18_036523, partial [Sarracenia purpurea var. burkii]